MLALLEQQQQSVRFRGGTDVLHALAAIQSHQGVLNRARQIRREAKSGMARALGRTEALPVQELIPLLPQEVRPLVSALVEENRALQVEVRDKAQRNERLLRQSADLMESFIRAFNQHDTQWLHAPAASGPATLQPALA